MNVRSPTSPAELADRLTQFVAYAMFAFSLMFCLSVAEFFANESIASVIDIAVKILGVAILGLMAVLFFWKIKPMSPNQRRELLLEDGFLQTAFRTALANSWMLSFLVLMILQAMDKLVLERLPAMPLEIVIKSVLGLMLLLFSLFFLLYTRSSASNE